MTDDGHEINEWLMKRYKQAREERDRYRGWFEKLLAGAWRHAGEDAELRATLQSIAAERDRLDAAVRDRTRPARAKRSELTQANRMRAAELRAAGMSAARIALRMTQDAGREDRPIDPGQVRRWLRKPRTD